MMKKMISVLLVFAMMLGACAAFAEGTEKTQIGSIEMKGAFTLKCEMPANYTLKTIEESPEKILAFLTPDDPRKPSVMVHIVFDEQYADVERMNDLTDEQLKVIESTYAEMDDVKFEYRETGLGTKILVVTEQDEDKDGDTDFVAIFTIYKGFDTEFVMTPGVDPTSDDGDDVDMTEAEIQMLIDFITGIDFVESEQAAPAAEQAPAVMGGWNAAADPAITDEIRAIVEKGLNGLVGVNYEPVTYLGTQVVAGRNHAVLCKASPVTLNAIPTWKILFFYEDLQGNVQLMNIADFDFGALCTYGSPAE